MSKEQIQKILDKAGITINGDRDYDIQVHNEALYKRVMADGSLGLGEAYMDGWWDCKNLDEFFRKVLGAELEKEVLNLKLAFHYLKAKLTNRQTKEKSKKVAQQHYDLGNSFYADMLDENMQYTCAYWKTAKTLDQAQIDKMDMVCKKIRLQPGDKVLELGCGWGMFAKYMAEKYGAEVTAYNISKEQVEFGKKHTKDLKVNINLQDYREASGMYDKIVSIGMAEHVGYKNYRSFLGLAYKCLKPGGLMLLHTIGGLKSQKTTEPWIEKYIFPNSMLPSIAQLSVAAEGLFVIEDLHNIGADYDPTLMAWYHNFQRNWHKHKEQYGQRFYRMWCYYLCSCAGGFRARKLQLWQFVLSKNPSGPYRR